MQRVVALIVCTIVLFAPSLGTTASAADAVVATTDAEIADLFSAFCLKSFPNRSALDKLAVAKKGTVMTADEVASFLLSDPGRGWFLRPSQALYAITIADPPYHTCTVRRMTPAGMSSVKTYLAAVKAYVAKKGAKLVSVPAKSSKTADGADIADYSLGMVGSAGKAVESFAVVLTNYHGRVPERWRPDAGSGAGVEVRMVHQMVKQ